jgi:uncharacterized protein YbjQ (UPF0145 family)
MNVTKAEAEAAQRLSTDETLLRAFDHARTQALEQLVKADAADANAVIRLQAKVAAIDDLRRTLAEIIIAAPREKQAVR